MLPALSTRVLPFSSFTMASPPPVTPQNLQLKLPSGVTADLTEGAEYYLDVAVVKGSKRHTKRVVCVAKYDDET